MRVHANSNNNAFVVWLIQMFYNHRCYESIKLFFKTKNKYIDFQTFINRIYSIFEFKIFEMRFNDLIWFYFNRVILIVRNDDVRNLNHIILNKLTIQFWFFNFVNIPNVNDDVLNHDIFVKFFQFCNSSSLSFSKLFLKIETSIMFMRNLFSKKKFMQWNSFDFDQIFFAYFDWQNYKKFVWWINLMYFQNCVNNIKKLFF